MTGSGFPQLLGGGATRSAARLACRNPPWEVPGAVRDPSAGSVQRTLARCRTVPTSFLRLTLGVAGRV